jgi:hypothetical protein
VNPLALLSRRRGQASSSPTTPRDRFRLAMPFRPQGGAASTSQGDPRTIFRRALEHDNLVLAEVTAREIGRVTIAEALELTALVARKQPHRYGRFAARWLCLWLEEHEKATLDDVELLVSNLRCLATAKDHASALATLRKVARWG